MKDERVILSGSGGQGLMFIGKLFAQMGMDVYPHVTFMPSYGAEVRGGTSHCRVILSEEAIASPVVEIADSLVVMNQPSLDRFLPALREGGRAIYNASMVQPPAGSVAATGVPATEWALEMGDARVANVIMLGAYLRKTELFPFETAEAAVAEFSAAKGPDAETMNRQALKRGWDAAGDGA